jgi:Trypsin-like peptidase domain
MKKITIACFVILPLLAAGQHRSWTGQPQESWPTIALSNHVQFKNGDKYVHSSFLYAGSGFLIDYKSKKLAITAKHILWIARNKNSRSVSINNELQSWVMKTKPASKDSVVIDRLINEDTNEVLEGSASSILERDILVLSVRSASPAIQTLTPRFTDVQPGEKVFLIGNPYQETRTMIHETKVVRKLGMDILIEQIKGAQYPGFSGSPVIDSNGHVVGVFSSTSYDPISGADVIVLTSMEYIRNVVEGKQDLNKPKEDYGKLILDTVLKKDAKKGIQQYETLTSDPKNYYKYNLRSATKNGLLETGEKLIEFNRIQDAITILEYNVKINSGYFHNYNVLAKAYLVAGNKEKAIENFRISTKKFDSKEENEAFKELEKFGER